MKTAQATVVRRDPSYATVNGRRVMSARGGLMARTDDGDFWIDNDGAVVEGDSVVVTYAADDQFCSVTSKATCVRCQGGRLYLSTDYCPRCGKLGTSVATQRF